jgi:hypothetical protein
MEDDFKQEEREKKAKLEPRRYPVNKPTVDLSFKPRLPSRGMLPRGGGGNPQNLIIYRSCGAKGHYSRECQKPKVICYDCNQEGHMKCPNKAAWGKKSSGGGPNRGGNSGGNGTGRRTRPFGKLNCTNLEEVNDSEKTVIGTLQILSHPGKLLFDTGATTSFISQEFVDLYGHTCNKLEYPITALSAGGNDSSHTPQARAGHYDQRLHLSCRSFSHPCEGYGCNPWNGLVRGKWSSDRLQRENCVT